MMDPYGEWKLLEAEAEAEAEALASKKSSSEKPITATDSDEGESWPDRATCIRALNAWYDRREFWSDAYIADMRDTLIAAGHSNKSMSLDYVTDDEKKQTMAHLSTLGFSNSVYSRDVVSFALQFFVRMRSGYK